MINLIRNTEEYLNSLENIKESPLFDLERSNTELHNYNLTNQEVGHYDFQIITTENITDIKISEALCRRLVLKKPQSINKNIKSLNQDKNYLFISENGITSEVEEYFNNFYKNKITYLIGKDIEA